MAPTLSSPLQSQLLLQVVDIDATGEKAGVGHDVAVQRDVGVDAVHDHLRERDLRARDRDLAPARAQSGAGAAGPRLSIRGFTGIYPQG